jgi:hypothetical protein
MRYDTVYAAIFITVLIILVIVIALQSKSPVVGSSEPGSHHNPKVVIKQYEDFNVVRDDLLLGGTKQRGAVPLLEHMKEKEFIYAGPPTGFAQIALALAAKKTGKKATLFISKRRPMYKQTKIAKRLGANIVEVSRAPLKKLREMANEYAKSLTHTSYVFKLGFEEQEFKNILLSSLREAIAGTPLQDFNGTLWVAGGSATLANIFYRLFPKAKINVVQIGKDIDWHIDRKRSDFYIAPEKFYEKARFPPPYPSVPEYDAKVWQFVKKHGEPGDYIWNVAG